MHALPLPGRWLDTALAILLFSATALYLSALPRSTGGIDEATYLNEALRVYRGEVVYRDFFDLTTPGWIYLLAGLFNVFGATFGTARIAAAVIQAATAVAVFGICRELDVRRALAAAAAVVCVASAHGNYPIASQHWLATMLSTVVLLTYLRVGSTVRGTFTVGFVLGLLIAVHQQRGASIGVGICLFLVADFVLDPRQPRAVAHLLRRAMALGAGVLVVDVPLLALLLSQTGFSPLWHALIYFPLVDYRRAAHCPWAFGLNPHNALAPLFRYLPATLVLSAIRTAITGTSPEQDARRRHIAIVALHGVASIMSIWYFPDRIHIAFIVPTFAALVAEHVEWLLRAMPRRLQRSLGFVIASAVLVSSGWWLRRQYIDAWSANPYAYVGPFGRVDVRHRETVELYTKVNALLEHVPARALYCYSTTTFACLFTDGRNPTRYELLMNNYNSAAQIAEATHALTIKDVPYLVALPATLRAGDPIAEFILRNYEPLDTGPTIERYIWRRKANPQ